ncbi:MAG: ATP-binding protein [Jatrophihabitans sp.]|uniref:ATP-binding protein n=1 Tax=Jatrophihabitans sp. TaxID=1932789 RepID=UPI00391301A7
MTIRSRLALIFSAVTLAILIGGSVLFISHLEGGLEQSLTSTAATHADTLAGVIGPNPPIDPRAWARQRGLFTSRGGSFDQLLTTRGQILGSSRALAQSPLLTSNQARAAAKHALVFDATVRLTVPTDSGPEPMRIFAERVGRSPVIVAVANSREVLDRAVTSARRELEILDLVVFVLGATGSWLLTRAALLPVERMRLQAADLDARNAGAGLRVPDSHDEIARLGHTFNRLLSRVHALVAREQALVADAGHELRTPLTVLKGELELARRPGRSVDELSRTVDVVAEETNRLVRLTEDLLFLSAEDDAGQPVSDSFDLSDAVADAVRAASATEWAREVTIIVAGEAPVFASGRPEWIRRAVDNLLLNAIRYAPAGSTITLTIRRDPQCTEVAVADEGPGFPPEFLPIAFNRFTRADGSRARADGASTKWEGSGLGLAIVQSIMGRHGGTAVAANRVGGGAQVVLRWPR